MGKNEFIKCPLNYPGGKFKLLDQLIPIFPNDIDCFYDIFGGAGNITANVNANKFVYNELNTYIYEIIKGMYDNYGGYIINRIHEIIEIYNPIEKEGFLKLREDYNSLELKDKYIYLMVLSSYSFNFMPRFNNKHKYNGSYAKGICKYNDSIENNLINFSKLLHKKQIKFINKDFREAIDINYLNENDFIYLDPPYYLSCGVYQDGKRGFSGWAEKDEKDMYDLCDKINEKGVRFALSNLIESKGHTHNKLIEWAENNKYKIIYLNKDKSLYNTNYQKKIKHKDTEVLVINY